jgi:hypothetical protein
VVINESYARCVLGGLWSGTVCGLGPNAHTIDVHLLTDDRRVVLTKEADGYFSGVVEQTKVGDMYVLVFKSYNLKIKKNSKRYT